MIIKQKILIITIALTVLCAISIFAASTILFVDNLNEAAKNRIDSASTLLEREIEQFKTDSCMAALELAHNYELRRAIEKQDRNEIIKVSSDIQDSVGVDFCTIMDPKGNVLLRTHEPENYGDNLASQANIQAAISGNVLTAIEQGSAIRLSVRTGTPVYDDNMNIVGIISVGYRFDTFEMVDELKLLTGCEVTIFLGNERISTTVINDKGERAVGTKADEKVSGKVLAGETYTGKAKILNRNATTKYIPLYGPENKIIGMIFAGEYTANDFNKITKYIFTSLVITLIVLAVSVFIAVYVSKSIEKQLMYIIDKVKNSTMAINSSTNGLTSISSNLSDSSSRQAASIEETSATMNETSSMISQNAENTKVAARIAEESQQAVSESSRYMGSLMETMGELKESSDKVSKIVKTIDDIAFQTNLLAINATVEAARAGGDAGRSFAVVAQEVRSLAQRSADASHETSEIIDKNITLTDTSRNAAEQVLELAQKNSEQMANLGKLVSEISAASEEQASGVKQINIAVSQMEKMTQENAAMAEETTASAQNLKIETDSLGEAVEEAYKLIKK